MWLLIDDQRDLNCQIIARTAEAGRIVLQVLCNQIETVCLDHDLGEKDTGYDICKWALESGCMHVLPGSHKGDLLPHKDGYEPDNLLTPRP